LRNSTESKSKLAPISAETSANANINIEAALWLMPKAAL
jgi:hypothetical protein